MRLIAPTILLTHWIGLLTYFTVTRLYPDQWGNYGWSVFYFTVNNLTIVSYCAMYITTEKDGIANQFVYVDLFFTILLMFLTVLQWRGIINSTYGFHVSVLGMIFTTILIVYNGIRYGYHKRYEND